MKKVLKVCICGMLAAMLVAGCAKKEAAEPAVAGDSVKLGNYKGVTYTPASTEVTDEDVEAEIQALVDANPTITEVERAAAEGDTVNIDYVGLKDGVAFDGGTAQGYDLVLGSGNFIDGFEDGLIGAAKGQELSLNLTFPEGYQNADLAGQAVVFDVTVNTVKESVPAELNDEFIKENTDSDSVAAYREATKADMIAFAEENALNQKKSDVFFKVIEGSEITVSEETVNKYYEEQLAMYESNATAYGMDLEAMVSGMGMTLDDFKAQLKLMAEEASKQNVVVNAIAEAEGFSISDQDMIDLAALFGYESKEAMVEQAGESVVNNYIMTEKVVDFIAENAVAE